MEILKKLKKIQLNYITEVRLNGASYYCFFGISPDGKYKIIAYSKTEKGLKAIDFFETPQKWDIVFVLEDFKTIYEKQ